jgi:hypothetical protein
MPPSGQRTRVRGANWRVDGAAITSAACGSTCRNLAPEAVHIYSAITNSKYLKRDGQTGTYLILHKDDIGDGDGKVARVV